MKPLLWKEMRDLRAWVLIGFGLAAALALMFQSPSFADRFLEGYLVVFMPFLVNVTAVGLGVGQVPALEERFDRVPPRNVRDGCAPLFERWP
jgi:hypothetical protein